MRPSIHAHTDPGAYLREAYTELKRSEPGVSHRYISMAIGHRSSAAFCLLMHGRMHPTARVLDGLADVFDLDRTERAHLSLLFAMRRVSDPILFEYIQRAFSTRNGSSNEPLAAPSGGASIAAHSTTTPTMASPHRAR